MLGTYLYEIHSEGVTVSVPLLYTNWNTIKQYTIMIIMIIMIIMMIITIQ
jgi:hypothetical protein